MEWVVRHPGWSHSEHIPPVDLTGVYSCGTVVLRYSGPITALAALMFQSLPHCQREQSEKERAEETFERLHKFGEPHRL
jgi:hypothetical protein